MFWPWIQILRAQVRETEPEELRAQLGSGAGEIVRLVPDLHERLPGVAPAPLADDAGARFRLFDSVGGLRASAAAQAAADSGRLRLMQVIEDGVDGAEGLLGARSAAVSPDGKTVYVASQLANALVVLARDLMTGQLTFVEVHRNGVDGVDGLGDAREVVVSPEGTHVYVASAGDSALVVFARNVMTGRLTFVQVQRDGLPGAGPDYGPVGLALSPDGAHVYREGEHWVIGSRG